MRRKILADQMSDNRGQYTATSQGQMGCPRIRFGSRCTNKFSSADINEDRANPTPGYVGLMEERENSKFPNH